MTKEESKELKELIETADLETQDYSGRGMYGDVCLAFCTDKSELNAFAQILDETAGDLEKIELLSAAMRDARVDNMGKGIVIYFPSFPYPDDEDEEYEGPVHCPDCGSNFDGGIEEGTVCTVCRRGIVRRPE